MMITLKHHVIIGEHAHAPGWVLSRPEHRHITNILSSSINEMMYLDALYTYYSSQS